MTKIYPDDIDLEEGNPLLLPEDSSDLSETESEADLAFQELAARIRGGKPLRGGTDWKFEDAGEGEGL